jgi:2-aminoadipate transaminase
VRESRAETSRVAGMAKCRASAPVDSRTVPVISFARGIPSPELLPAEAFGESVRAALDRDGETVLNYGPPGGYEPLREWLAERHRVSPSRVVVTNGSLQGLSLVFRRLLAEPGRVLVEAPTYDRTLVALRTLGAQVEAIPLADDGLDVGQLADALARGEPPKLLYTIPTFQNPSGRTLSLASRRALVELASERGVLVYEDDPYALVRFDGEPVPTLHELAAGDGVIYASSFSKTVAPGIRVGYLVLPEELVAPIEALVTETYLSPTLFVQGALFDFVASGRFEANLERVRAGLGARRDAMLRALARELPGDARWNEPDGGYFLWLDFPPGVDAGHTLERAAEAGVTFVKGSDFFAGSGGERSARLAFSFASPQEIEDGVARLAPLVREASAVAA